MVSVWWLLVALWVGACLGSLLAALLAHMPRDDDGHDAPLARRAMAPREDRLPENGTQAPT